VSIRFDRSGALRSAEKLLRIGKLDLAIGEYRRVVAECPDDTGTATLLANLYLRAGETDLAVDQFTRVADAFRAQGLLSEAAAAYKQILATGGDGEHALLQLAELAVDQQHLADARSYFTAVAERRLARGDTRAAAEIVIRAAELDPEDFDARLAGARARQQIGDVDGALTEFHLAAIDLLERGQHAEAATVLQEAARLAPDDTSIRDRLFDAYLLAGRLTEARAAAVTPSHWKRLATTLLAVGDADALEVLREATERLPGDLALRACLASWFVARGDAAAAADHLTPEMAGEAPELLLAIAEIQLRGGREDDAVALAERCIASDPTLLTEVSALGAQAASAAPNAAWRLVRLAVEGWAARSDWPAAASSLEEFVSRVPGWTPALMRLVEVAIDGELPDVACRAQAQLADAYLQAGAAAEAAVVIEDLVSRERDNPAHIERLREALTALGEPEAAIQRRLNASRSS